MSINFSNFSLDELIEEYSYFDSAASSTLKGSKDEQLSFIEEVAEFEGEIPSERALSDLFDDEIASLVIEEYGEDDEPAMNETFNNWTDGLRANGQIHEIQYDQYCYVGRYAK